MLESPYNATVVGKIMITPDLMVLRVRTDTPREKFLAGQFTRIGLLASEGRSPNSILPLEQLPDNDLIKRPYSIASANHETSIFEFYISQVKSGQLTPRLFYLNQGSRMWVDDRIVGLFALNQTPPGSNIVMIATGTGLAPYISFLRSHITDHRETKLAILHGAAYQWDLGYYSELTFIDSVFTNFYYFPTLVKADNNWQGLKGYIEQHLKDDVIGKIAGIRVDHEKTHFYLCGNPKMVESVTNFLKPYNYVRHTSKRVGSLHIEEY